MSAGAVHPRACGGDDTCECRRPIERRFIPARAGETRQISPRCACPSGSSPRVRGRRGIAARAASSTPVHPRACGGDAFVVEGGVVVGGSSPRVRGNVCSVPYLREDRPVHPRACGETRRSRRAVPVPPVHPRACGERLSPRDRAVRRQRFIPARAGERRSAALDMICAPVHPRACGGDGHGPGEVAANVGSSPRVRGRLVRGLTASGPARFIPARAGETAPAASTGGACPVHPRACGGEVTSSTCATLRPGSSPRVRGRR